MVEDDDKYAENEEDLSQVRSIIKHLNEDKPSKERTREVVVRADGTKVIRVTKKRRVMLTSADVRRRNRRQFLLVLAAAAVLLVACGAYLLFRMTVMSSSSYLEEKRLAMQQAWGATMLELDGPGVNGTSFSLNSVVAEFPEGNMLKRVELEGISSKLDIMSFLSGRLESEKAEIASARIVLRDGARMQVPLQSGPDMWRFRRMDCKNFSIGFENDEQGPFQLKSTQAYMYYPGASHSSCVVMLRGGALDLTGWKTVHISDGKAHLSSRGVTDFAVSGTTDVQTDDVEQRHSTISFAGKAENGVSLAGPYAVESDNMSLADFSEGRFANMLTARTVSVSHGKLSGKATVMLSEGGAQPRFNGEFHIKDACLSSFPAMMSICEHIEPSRRRMYNPITIHRGRVVLTHSDAGYVLEIPEGGLEERDLATLSGKLEINPENELSGELRYGVPLVLARMEYPDGSPDPIFRESGEWAILTTRLKGIGNRPEDDMAEIETRAAQERKNRPERIPFDHLDVNRLLREYSGESTPQTDHAGDKDAPEPPPFIRSSDLENPFNGLEDPYSPSVPF